MMEGSESDSFTDILLSWSLEDIVNCNLYKHKVFNCFIISQIVIFLFVLFHQQFIKKEFISLIAHVAYFNSLVVLDTATTTT